MRSTALAYLFWLLGFIGVCGVHRMYAGKWVSGIIWFLTLGLFGFGQLIDLFLIPGMITNANLRAVAFGNQNRNSNVNNVVVNVPGLSHPAQPPSVPVKE
ncbi:MAG: NINE protein [Planctomycetota bacterium]